MPSQGNLLRKVPGKTSHFPGQRFLDSSGLVAESPGETVQREPGRQRTRLQIYGLVLEIECSPPVKNTRFSHQLSVSFSILE